MLDIGWSELLVIAVVLIVVVGPKDLPPMLRAFGRMSRKFAAMAGDFRKQFDDALNEADMGDLRQTISDVRRMNPGNSLREAMNPLRQAAEEIRSDIRSSIDGPGAKPGDAPTAAILRESAPVVTPAEAKTAVPATATIVGSASVLSESIAVRSVEETTKAEPKPKRKPKAVSALGKTGVEPVAKTAHRRKTSSTVKEASTLAADGPETRRKTATGKNKDKA